MSTQEIINNLKLLRRPELEMFKQFVISSGDFPPGKGKFALKFRRYHPDIAQDDVYKTHVFTTLLGIMDEIPNCGFNKTNFITMLNGVTPDSGEIENIVRVKQLEQNKKVEMEKERNRVEEEARKAARKEASSPNAKKEAEEKAKKEAEEKARKEAEARARKEAERREAEKKEAEARARKEAERREAEKKEAEARARKEAEERARKEAERREAEKKEAEARARKEAEERARKEAEERAKKEPEARARKEAEGGVRRERRERGGVRFDQSSIDFAIFKNYYQSFCAVHNQVMLDEKSLERSFTSFKTKKYQKFKSENGVLKEDGNKINDVEFLKFLAGSTCEVDNKDPFLLAMREYYIFSEFRSNYALIVESPRSIPHSHPKISESQLKQTFDSFRRGEYKVYYSSSVVEYDRKVVNRLLSGALNIDLYQSAEVDKISSDPVLMAYNLVHSRYFSKEKKDEAEFPENVPNSQNNDQNAWESILSSLDRAKEYLLKLSKELEKIKLPDDQKSKFQDLKDFFEKLAQKTNAPTSNAPTSNATTSNPIFQTGRSFSNTNRNTKSAPDTSPIKGSSDENREPSTQTKPKQPSKIAYYGKLAKELEKKHKAQGKVF